MNYSSKNGRVVYKDIIYKNENNPNPNFIGILIIIVIGSESREGDEKELWGVRREEERRGEGEESRTEEKRVGNVSYRACHSVMYHIH